MDNQQEYRRHIKERRRKRKLQRRLRLALILMFLLLLAGLITLLLNLLGGRRNKEAPQATPAPAQTTSVLAPLPFDGQAQEDEGKTLGPVQQSGEYTLTAHDFSDSSLPERGMVTTAYFSDAAFLGDSITQGLSEYDFGLSGALLCGYVGTSPIEIVNGTSIEHSERGEEVPMEVLAEAQPAKLYILMGANLLVTEGIDDSFLAYYGRMLDMLKERLPNTLIYVQSLLPVQAWVTEERPGLDNERFRTLNEQLRALADERGLYYLNLQEQFADADGNLKEEYASGDGMHLTIAGYQAWINYLCSHTVYDPANPWLPGSTYYRAGDP